MRPIDIARKLNISTSTLRNYERQGLVPPANRSLKGQRSYTELHFLYFECIQAMAPGFGMEATSEVLKKLRLNEFESALWIVNDIQAKLNCERRLAENNIQLLTVSEANSSEKEHWMTIGEVSNQTSIPSSTIRYWEKEGLVTSSRNPENGYRVYNRSQIRKIWLLRTLRSAVYSQDVVTLKQAIAEMLPEDIDHSRQIAYDTLKYLSEINKLQMRGVYFLYRLYHMLK